MSSKVQKSKLQKNNQAGKPAQPKVDWKALEVVHPDAAGIDIGGSEHWVAISPDRDERPVRSFECFTADLEQMADWLVARGVQTVAMQSTGVYWMPVLEILQQRGMQVYLVNARHTKNLPGRKSDIAECQWLLKLHTFGLLNNSFQPPDAVRAMRTLWRHRAGLVAQAGSAIQRMQKALIEMNIQLSHVLSDLSGVSGMAILQAMLDGERDPDQLAALANPQVKGEPRGNCQKLARQLAAGVAVRAGTGGGELSVVPRPDHRLRRSTATASARHGVESRSGEAAVRSTAQRQASTGQCS